MAELVRVPVIKAFKHDRHVYQPGESISIPPIVAAVYARRGLVSLTRGRKDIAAETPAPEPEPEIETPRRRRRHYKRRDMVAEPS